MWIKFALHFSDIDFLPEWRSRALRLGPTGMEQEHEEIYAKVVRGTSPKPRSRSHQRQEKMREHRFESLKWG